MGTIPDSDFFAGQVLDTCLEGGQLWSCAQCGSMFRHPVLSAQQYLALYRVGASDQWQGDDHREDLRIIRSIVAGAGTSSVLDVGCGSGDFLATLAMGMVKCGIEPSPAAAVAARRGIEIVAPELAACSADRLFDAVTIIDVVEHVIDPGTMLAQAYRHVAPGGLLVVATGNPGTVAWRRWFRARFWYVSFPEHVSFPSIRFFQSWSQRAGAAVIERHETRYRRMHLPARIVGCVIQLLFALNHRLLDMIGRVIGVFRGDSRRRRFSPGIPGVFVDHHVVVIKKPVA